MKNLFMIKTGAIAFITMLACYALTGCTDNDVYNPEKGKPELKPESEYFDFATTGNVAFDVNYGKLAGGALLEFFTEDPISYNEDGSYVINGEAQYKIYADANGRFAGNVELPTAANKVYIYSPSWGAPMIVEASVENGQVTVDKTGADTRVAATTRVIDTPTADLIDKDKRLYSIVKWGQAGCITDENKIITQGSLTSEFINEVQNGLWQGYGYKIHDLDNSGLVRGTEKVNTTILNSYEKDGKPVEVEDTEIYLTFLTESAHYESTLGYYYYKTGEAPSSPDKVDKYIIIPNASVAGNFPYEKLDNPPMATNTKIQLLYKGEDGFTTKFPPGYTIGYFLISDAKANTNSINCSQPFIYSNAEWNDLYEGQKARFISVEAKDGTIVYGIEDGVDKSYEDVLFCISADPNESIKGDRPHIPTPTPKPSVETNYNTYAYEDIWPTGGDYDLNDVIIEHKREITFKSIEFRNYVTEVKDTFTPVQKDGAATYTNAFAVQYVSNQRGNMTLPSGAIDETETGSIILFSDAKAAKGQSFVVTREFKDGSMLKNDLATDTKYLNPFIISKYVAGDKNRDEVHLPKYKPTEFANTDKIGAADDAYYINKDGKYPFAIMIPGIKNGAWSFIPAEETVSIDLEYPDFTKWVESGGTTNGDWYKYYHKSK